MTPSDALKDIVGPNIAALCADVGDLRLAVNAILSLDAMVGIIHADLKRRGKESGGDAAFRDRLARQHLEYSILRDAAFALKHGELEHKKVRLVQRADQVKSYSAAWGEAVWGRSTYGTAVIWIEANDPTH